MNNKIFTINNFKIRFKTIFLGLLSIIILWLPFAVKDTIGTPVFIFLIITTIVLVSLTFIQSCILQYQYWIFDKQTKIIIDRYSERIKYIRNGYFFEFHMDDISNFYKVRNENSRRLQEFFYQIYIKDHTIPIAVTCVLAYNLNKYIKKDYLVRITDSLHLDKEEYDTVLKMDYEMKQL